MIPLDETLASQYQADLLKELSIRVTQRRHSMGLSIKECAASAGLSSRYLIQVEAGQANISLGKLSRLCLTLEVRLAELLSQGPRGQIDALLSKLNTAQLTEAHDLLKSHFRPQRPSMISLLGVRGAGKSTVGKRLADRLGWEMIELDEEIEKRAGLSLSELFSVHGEPYYRRLEGEVLRHLQSHDQSAVIATGGSIVTHHLHYSLLKSMSSTVFLQATAAEHMERVVAQGDKRPMRDHPQAMKELERLLAERAPLYKSANLIIDTSHHSISEIIETLMEWRRAVNQAVDHSES